MPCSSGTVLDLAWQYWTVSEKRRAKAARETSCLPLLRLLSKIVVLALRLGGTREEEVISPTGIPCLCIVLTKIRCEMHAAYESMFIRERLPFV